MAEIPKPPGGLVTQPLQFGEAWQQMFSNIGKAAYFPVSNQWYHNQTINLDGYNFTSCHFDNCNLVISKGTFDLINCKITSCTFHFKDEAFKVIQALNVVNQEAYAKWPNMCPIINNNGTFTFRQS